MSRDHHARVKEIFLAAVDLTAEERATYLDRACGGDPELRAEVEGMLAFDEADPAFLEQASASSHGAPVDDDSSSRDVLMRLEDRIGRESRYELQGEFARGGMGAILRVWDRDLRRSLAMKVILDQSATVRGEASGALDQRSLGRFLEEAQVTGQLDHPGVVPVHELGLDAEGRVFFTMKLVKGRDLKEIFDLVRTGAEGWTETRAVGVILKVCDAMAYAHSKRVIHRDLKPANIMVGRFGEVYVLDWGLAHVAGQRDNKDIRLRPLDTASVSRVRTDRRRESGADSPLVTMDGDVVGTPAFMSPEQARGDIAAMGPASDVYSLGAILYDLLAGHMPYVPPGARLNAHAVWALAQQGPPAPVAEAAPNAPEELVAICQKAMAAAPSDRYSDMGAMAEDLRAYVEGRVVKAHRTGALAELRKWIGRNTGLASALVAAAVLLVAGTITSSLLYIAAKASAEDARTKETAARDAEGRASREAVRANQETERANNEASRANAEAARANRQAERAARSAEEARKQSYVANFRAATISFEAGNRAATRLALAACELDLRGWEWDRYDLLEQLARRGWSRPHVIEQAASRVSAVAFSPDDSVAATASGSSTVRLWDAFSGEPVAALEGHAAGVLALAFHPDGTRLAAASATGVVRVWNRRTGATEATLEGHTAAVRCVTYTPDGGSILSGSEDGSVRLWNAETGAPLAVFLGHEGGVRELALLAGGRRLATVSRQGVLRLWDVASRTIVDTREVAAFAGGYDLTRIACSSGDGLQVCDAESGAVVAALEGHAGEVYRIALSPDGSRLVSAAWDDTLRLWDFETAQAIAVLPGHSEFISEIVFADRPVFATASWDKTVRLWDANAGELVRTLPAHPKWVNRIAIDSLGSRLLSASAGQVRLWDGVSGDATVTWPTGHEVRALSYALDGSHLVTASADGAIGKWDAAGEEVALAADADPCDDPLARMWEARTGETLACGHDHDVAVVAHGGGGERVAAACSRVSAAMCLWDRGTGRLIGNLQPADSGWSQRVTAVAFSPRGSLVASAVSTGRIHLWNSADGELLRTIKAHGQSVTSLGFDPEGARIVSCSADTIRLWDVSSGATLPLASAPPLAVEGPAAPGAPTATRREAAGVAYSPDGSRIVAGFVDGALCLWDGSTGDFLAVLEGHQGPVRALGFSPAGTRIFSGSLDNTVRLWDAEAGMALAVLAGYVPEVVEDGGTEESTGEPPDPGDEDVAEWQEAMSTERVVPIGVTAVAFSPDGSRIVAAFVDGTLRTWLAGPDDARAAWTHGTKQTEGGR
ncbi:MAG: protein kinase [bacterium]|nr:protein kinase [bacterium]